MTAAEILAGRLAEIEREHASAVKTAVNELRRMAKVAAQQADEMAESGVARAPISGPSWTMVQAQVCENAFGEATRLVGVLRELRALGAATNGGGS